VILGELVSFEGLAMCVAGCEEVVRAALSRRGFFKGATAAAFAATAVGAEPAVAQELKFRNVIDLTHTMSPEFPTFFGVPGIEMQRQFDFKKDGFNLYWWRIVEHAGTHLDAPIHFSEKGMTADQIAVSSLIVPLAVVDVTQQAATNADYQMTRADLESYEKKHGRIPDNACVAMNSGWARYAGDAAKFTGKDTAGTFHFPGISPDAAEWLLTQRKVAGIAVDTLSLDHGPSKDFKTHYTWLPTGRWGLENVAGLDQVPATGATLVVGASKVKDATGGIARLFALV
jgi:kynurenine formamidase